MTISRFVLNNLLFKRKEFRLNVVYIVFKLRKYTELES